MPFSTSALAENLSHDARLKVLVTGADSLFGAANQFYRLVLNPARNAQRAGATELTIDIWQSLWAASCIYHVAPKLDQNSGYLCRQAG